MVCTSRSIAHHANCHGQDTTVSISVLHVWYWKIYIDCVEPEYIHCNLHSWNRNRSASLAWIGLGDIGNRFSPKIKATWTMPRPARDRGTYYSPDYWGKCSNVCMWTGFTGPWSLTEDKVDTCESMRTRRIHLFAQITDNSAVNFPIFTSTLILRMDGSRDSINRWSLSVCHRILLHSLKVQSLTAP